MERWSLIEDLKGTKWETINFARRIWVRIPRIGYSIPAKAAGAGTRRTPVQVGNHSLSAAIDAMNMGIGVKSHCNYFRMEWDNAGKDGK